MHCNYKTIQENAQGEYEISRSRFIAYLARVHSTEEAIAWIGGIRKKHWDARHNCAAYIVGDQIEIQKADDDGEPNGTAGKPMLEVLKKQELKNVAAVVTRYFGGIKLGAAGLIRAYAKAVTIALEQTVIVERTLFSRCIAELDYTLLGTVENHLHQTEFIIEHKEYTDKVRLTILAKKQDNSQLEESLIDWTAANCTLIPSHDVYLEIPINKSQN